MPIYSSNTKNATWRRWVHQRLVGVVRNHIDGFTMSTDTDADHDILIQPGGCADTDNEIMMNLDTAITKQIDANWAAGDDAGGFPSGLTLAADTWYHVFIISDETNVDAGFDTDINAANLLADATGYTHYRRIGSILTNATSNIWDFLQVGDYFRWLDTDTEDVNDGSPNNGGTPTMRVPPGVRVLGRFGVTGDYTGASATFWVGEYENFTGGNPTGLQPSGTIRVSSSATFNHIVTDILTDTSGRIGYEGDTNNSRIRIGTIGWKDFRGTNGTHG